MFKPLLSHVVVFQLQAASRVQTLNTINQVMGAPLSNGADPAPHDVVHCSCTFSSQDVRVQGELHTLAQHQATFKACRAQIDSNR